MSSLENNPHDRRTIGDRRDGGDRRSYGYEIAGFIGGFEIPQDRSGNDRRKICRRDKERHGEERHGEANRL